MQEAILVASSSLGTSSCKNCCSWFVVSFSVISISKLASLSLGKYMRFRSSSSSQSSFI